MRSETTTASAPIPIPGCFRKADRGGKVAGVVFAIAFLSSTLVAMALLAVLLVSVWKAGHAYLSLELLRAFPSRFADRAGLYPALMGTLWLMGCTVAIAIPVGVGAAVYLEEFAPKNRWTGWLELNINNLAGVPSIVYGLLGLTLFVRYFSMGRSILAGALTLSLLVMPVIIVSAREAIRSVPHRIRNAGLAVGATRWQTVRSHILPAAAPGILTGTILALSRAVGETAPLAVLGAFSYVSSAPEGLFDTFTALPLQIYYWAGLPQKEFHAVAAAAIIVFLGVLLTLNAAAIALRYFYSKETGA